MPEVLNPSRETVKALFIQGLSPDKIEAETGVNTNTVCTWARRGKWKNLRATVRKEVQTINENREIRNLENESALLREKLSGELHDQVSALRSKPVKSPKELGNSRFGDGRASIAKKIIESASTLYGWDSASKASLLQVNVMAQVRLDKLTDSPADSIEVSSSVQPDSTPPVVPEDNPS